MRRHVFLLVLVLLGMAGCGDDLPTPPAIPTWAKVSPEQIAEAKKHGVPVAFENDLGMRFVLIPAGTFTRGAPETWEGRTTGKGPQHEVTITKSYYMQTTEVTNVQYRQFRSDHDSGEYAGNSLNGDNQPVVNVSWEDCQKFVKRLNETVPGGGYGLPTDAEWEYACRAGTTTRFWSGDAEEDLKRVGWCRENGGGVQAVGEKPANPWGLHDMHGNVWEWCADWPGAYEPGGVTDPRGKDRYGFGIRMVRGASWYDSAFVACSANGHIKDLGHRDKDLGFRLARTVTSK